MKAYSFDNKQEIQRFKDMKSRLVKMREKFEFKSSDVFAKSPFKIEDEIDMKLP